MIGFNDIGKTGMCHPALTTVARQPRHIGEVAACLLLERIAESHAPQR